ncbi:MAG TPA: 2-hydroxychromene-2-carboxylate isomerase [Methylibium sp.]|nr:2-hydroxychromene-2-carboxylate isomerase [Methylibium sp.]
MSPITFWFDPISPYAYLAFERLPQALEGCSYAVEYRPVLLAGLLKHWGQRGPVEIAPKRDWTYRQVQWLAHQQGSELALPAAHPFNPLPLLRLLVACGRDGRPNRWQCEAVLHHVWRGGAPADDPQRLAELAARLAPPRDPQAAEVKEALRCATDEAIARGVFGVPTLELPARAAGAAPQCFWGLDALPMLRAALDGDPWFEGAPWQAPLPAGDAPGPR